MRRLKSCRKILLPVFLLMVSSGAYANTALINSMVGDLSGLFGTIGGRVLPYVKQDALIGTSFGAAEMDDSVFVWGFNFGVIHGGGLLNFEDSSASLLDYGAIFDTFLGGDPESGLGQFYDMTKTYFPYPSTRTSIGFSIFDYESIISFSYIPAALVTAITEQIPASGDFPLSGISARQLHVGYRFRKSIVEDSGWVPALSIGGGYVYQDVRFGMTGTFDIGNLGAQLGGTFAMDWAVHSAGIEAALSKKIGCFTPYVRFGAWYQWARFTGTLENLSAEIASFPISVGDVDPVVVNQDGLHMVIQTGFDLIFSHVSLNLDGAFSLDSKAFSTTMGIRFHTDSSPETEPESGSPEETQ